MDFCIFLLVTVQQSQHLMHLFVAATNICVTKSYNAILFSYNKAAFCCRDGCDFVNAVLWLHHPAASKQLLF